MVREMESPTPMPLGFEVTKGLEELRQYIGGDARARVAVRLSAPCWHPHAETKTVNSRVSLLLHRLHGIANQIYEHLLDLYLVSQHGWQIVPEIEA